MTQEQSINYERHSLRATAIFELRDLFADWQRTRGAYPRPIGPVQFLLTGHLADHEPGRIFDPPLELIVYRNPGGYYLFFNEVRLPGPRPLRPNLPDPRVRQRFLPSGISTIRVESQFYQPAGRDNIRIPQFEPTNPDDNRAPYVFDLLPASTYPLPYSYPCAARSIPPAECTSVKQTRGNGPTLLRGCLYATNGHGISSVTVSANAKWHCSTDDSGNWVLVFPSNQATGPVAMHFQWPDGHAEDVDGVCVVEGRVTGLSQTSLRGRVLSSAGVAIENATIRVATWPETSSTREDGSWFYYFGLKQPPADTIAVDVTARLPDGRSQTKPGVQIVHGATVTVPTFRFG